MADICGNCLDAQWVCENHPDRPWGGMIAAPTACECGAGQPCGACRPEMACAGRVETERESIIAWLKSWPEHYSGWNDHDEHFDSGFNSAVRQVIEGLESGAWRDALAAAKAILEIENARAN